MAVVSQSSVKSSRRNSASSSVGANPFPSLARNSGSDLSDNLVRKLDAPTLALALSNVKSGRRESTGS